MFFYKFYFMIFLIIITFVISVLLISKYVFFLIMLPIMKLFSFYKKKCVKKSPHNTGMSESPVSSSLLLIIRSFIGNFIVGYERYFMIRVGYISSSSVRMFFYKKILKVIVGKNVIIHYGAEIRGAENLKIGDGTIIGDKAILDARNGLIIGKNVNLSTNVTSVQSVGTHLALTS
jgi:hypothetical protein